MDILAIGVHEIANMSEARTKNLNSYKSFMKILYYIFIFFISFPYKRRMERLCNPSCSHLPAFLAPEGGLNSGFMMAHVTASALVSENKVKNLTVPVTYIKGYKIFQLSRTFRER